MTPPHPQLPDGAFLDVDHDDSWIGKPPLVYGPQRRPSKTGAELDALIDAGGLPQIPAGDDD